MTAGALTVRAIGNAHLGRYAERVQTAGAANQMLAHMFVAEVGERKLFYSADLSSFEEARPYLDGCSIVLIEGSHVDITRLFEIARTLPVTQYVIIHLGPEEEIARLVDLVEKSGLANVTLAEPGRVLGL